MFEIIFTVFIFSLFLPVYTYLLFPLGMVFFSGLFKIDIKKKPATPNVSIIISAFNEEKHIKEKIDNTMALDYPVEKMEILVGSDGSTDETAAIVKNLENENEYIRFVDFKSNRGKTSVQNDLVEMAKGEILVFMDAASFLPSDALNEIVKNFSDSRIGCVAGRMVFVDQNRTITTQSQGVYWHYEMKIKQMESRLGRLIGVDGPLYAVRKKYYIPLASNIISDLMTPLLILAQGKAVILEPNAIVEEEPTRKGTQEFATRRRITLRGLVGIFSHRQVINPFKNPLLTLHIFSHKIIRWGVGLCILVNISAALLLLFYNFLFGFIWLLLYCFFFLAAGIGWYCDKTGVKVKLLTIPFYFCLVNMAATCGVIDFLTKKQAVTWQTVRE